MDGPKSGAGSRFDGSDRVFILCGLFLCLLMWAGIETNCFPEDRWFWTKSDIFRHSPGRDNYTPIAAPAFFYGMIHLPALLFSLDLTTEFYLAGFFNQLLLLFTVFLLYRSARVLDFKISAVISSLCLLLFAQSTFAPCSFWSEGVCLALTAGVLHLSIRIYRAPSDGRREGLHAVALGGVLGLYIITRAIPAVFFAGLVPLIMMRRRKTGRLRICFLVLAVSMFVILGQMAANKARFGRFELTNSKGRHLWNAVSHESDVMLEGSEDYEILERWIPDVQGRQHWDIEWDQRPNDFDALSKEIFLEGLASEAIGNRPDVFLRLGIAKFRRALPEAPRTFGLWAPYMKRDPDHNPLNRDTMLPPTVPGLNGLHSKYESLNRDGARIYGPLVFITVMAVSYGAVWKLVFLLIPGRRAGWRSILAAAAGQAALAATARIIGQWGTGIHWGVAVGGILAVVVVQRHRGSSIIRRLDDETRQSIALLFFSTLLFMLGSYATIQLEFGKSVSRYPYPYLPFLFLNLLLLARIGKRAVVAVYAMMSSRD